MRSREVVESPLVQGVDEEIPYVLDITRWGSSPSDISVVAYDDDANDVSGAVLSGSPSALNDTSIQLPTVLDLTAGTEYRIEVKFTVSGAVLETYFYIRAEE